VKRLFLNPTGTIGGAERVLLSVLAAVRDHRPADQIHLLTLTDGPLLEAARGLGATAAVVPVPPALGRLGDSQLRQGGTLRRVTALLGQTLTTVPTLATFVGRLRRQIARLGPDLIHSNGIKTHVLVALARPAPVPVVWHVHDFYGARPLMRRLLPWLQRRVAAALAISAAVGRDVHALLPRVPVTVVHNGVDVSAFAPGPGDGDWLDRLAGLGPAPADVVRVGLVATYARWKGHGVFLEALARLRHGASGPPVRGYVVGGPLYQTQGSQVTREELQGHARRLRIDDCVGLVEFQPDPAPVYRALDVVVHASTQPEPFGLTIVEAMACGRAVVVSRAGGAAELFTDDRDALGVPPGDAAELAAALRRLAAEERLRQRLGASARATAVTRFGQERFAGEVMGFYGSLPAGMTVASN
jgi:glycosyltransferase involved in cell wall biosynthesis